MKNKFFPAGFLIVTALSLAFFPRPASALSPEETQQPEQKMGDLKTIPLPNPGLLKCIDSVKGLRWTMMAEKLKQKLAAAGKLPAEERKAWEADIASLETAGEKGLGLPTPVDPKQPARFLSRLTSKEQKELHEDYLNENQDRISQCSATAQSAGKKKRPRPKKEPGSIAHEGSDGSFAPALKASELEYVKNVQACYEPLKGHLAKLTADRLEAKLKASSKVSSQKRKEWKADIAAWRAAEKAGVDQVTPPDPKNPYRWYGYLNADERAAIQRDHKIHSDKIISACAYHDSPAAPAVKKADSPAAAR